MTEDALANALRTPLYNLHLELGARMVPFAGHAMPVQYPTGILFEHRHTRDRAGLFDVSHMGQVRLLGAGADIALERLVPGDIVGLAGNRQRYTQFTEAGGGILDDLMVTRREGDLLLVVNAGCKAADVAHLKAALEPAVRVELLSDRALLALQGPAAAAVLARLAPGVERLAFMAADAVKLAGIECWVSRSGYTGEDGYEISLPGESASDLARRLLSQAEVKPIGLGARDTLRLEAGLCLYGHDIDRTTSPAEAGLAWSIGKRRRQQGGFPGAARIGAELAHGPARRRVGLLPQGRQPVREGAVILDAEGNAVGRVSSGGFGPSADRPIAMGYVPAGLAMPGTPLGLEVRGKTLPAAVARLPFVAHRYHRD
ncbi:MAG: glycine cleavage system aminomethyltransferase GcvT [Alphaproteobacteria bacterium]|nr:glycine cleavage system aminomethyltransferase GcvT [Alphaproteobacteria bacterium]